MKDDNIQYLLSRYSHAPICNFYDLVEWIQDLLPEDREKYQFLEILTGIIKAEMENNQSSIPVSARNDKYMWLRRAIGSDITRPNITCLFRGEAQDLVATDGHRMHIVHNSPVHLDAVWYGYKRNKLEAISNPRGDEYGGPPPYQRILESCYNFDHVVENIKLTDFGQTCGVEGKEILKVGDVLLSGDYVRQALAYNTKWTCYFGESLDPVKFTAAGMTAIVMPRKE